MNFDGPTASAEDEAPALPDRLPWAAHESEFVEPPKPWAHRVELTEADVEAMTAAASTQAGGVPWYAALVVYAGLRFLVEDLPDFTLYALFGGVFLLNRVLAYLKAQKHYAQPGTVTMTISADGIEVSAENFAGHHPWVEISRFTRDDEYVWVRTRTKPGLHALPLRGASPESVAELDTWIEYRHERTPKRTGRWALLVGLAIAVLVFALLWGWDLVQPYLPG